MVNVQGRIHIAKVTAKVLVLRDAVVLIEREAVTAQDCGQSHEIGMTLICSPTNSARLFWIRTSPFGDGPSA